MIIDTYNGYTANNIMRKKVCSKNFSENVIKSLQLKSGLFLDLFKKK